MLKMLKWIRHILADIRNTANGLPYNVGPDIPSRNDQDKFLNHSFLTLPPYWENNQAWTPNWKKILYRPCSKALTDKDSARAFIPLVPSPWWLILRWRSWRWRRKYEAGTTPLFLHVSMYDVFPVWSYDAVWSVVGWRK